MHEIVLDGTPDGKSRYTSPVLRRVSTYSNIDIPEFAEHASVSGRNLEQALDQLKDM
jgi:hypothetical protein